MFILYNKISDTDGQVYYMNPNPDDPITGVSADIKAQGLVIDSMPEAQPPIGQMVAETHINLQTKEITYDYKDIPKSQEQIISDLQGQNAQMILALVQGGLM